MNDNTKCRKGRTIKEKKLLGLQDDSQIRLRLSDTDFFLTVYFFFLNASKKIYLKNACNIKYIFKEIHCTNKINKKKSFLESTNRYFTDCHLELNVLNEHVKCAEHNNVLQYSHLNVS